MNAGLACLFVACAFPTRAEGAESHIRNTLPACLSHPLRLSTAPLIITCFRLLLPCRWVEHDPLEIWRTVQECLGRAWDVGAAAGQGACPRKRAGRNRDTVATST